MSLVTAELIIFFTVGNPFLCFDTNMFLSAKIMIKSYKKIITLVCLLFVFSVCTSAQTKSRQGVTTTLNGCYAGNSIPRTDPFGGGMTLETFTFYFRPNGTFITELDESDWQTRIDGTYKISGNKVFIQSKLAGDSPEELEIKSGETDLGYRGTNLFKLNIMNSIPAVIVENISASSSGGIGTDRIFVGVSSANLFNFDGKGNFSNDSSGTSFVSGENIAAGTNRNNNGFGTYTIKDSLLTLNYKNGTVVKKSFFYSDSDGDGTALINGSFYFEPDEKEAKNNQPNNNQPNENQKTNPIAANNPLPKKSEIAQQGLSILKKANFAHGGTNLDKLETLRLIGKGSGLDIVILVDVKNQRIRNEVRKKGILVQVEQFDGNDNWLFADGKKTKLHEVREVEMRKTLKTGLFVLQSQTLANTEFLTVEVNNQTNLKSLMLLIDGKKHGMIFDADNRLVAEVSADDGILQTEYSEDFKPVNGILLPFKSKFVEGTKSIEVKYSAIEVNPSLSEKDWQIPN